MEYWSSLQGIECITAVESYYLAVTSGLMNWAAIAMHLRPIFSKFAGTLVGSISSVFRP
jgi:hypothetical protein